MGSKPPVNYASSLISSLLRGYNLPNTSSWRVKTVDGSWREKDLFETYLKTPSKSSLRIRTIK